MLVKRGYSAQTMPRFVWLACGPAPLVGPRLSRQGQPELGHATSGRIRCFENEFAV